MDCLRHRCSVALLNKPHRHTHSLSRSRQSAIPTAEFFFTGTRCERGRDQRNGESWSKPAQENTRTDPGCGCRKVAWGGDSLVLCRFRGLFEGGRALPYQPKPRLAGLDATGHRVQRACGGTPHPITLTPSTVGLGSGLRPASVSRLRLWRTFISPLRDTSVPETF